MPRVAPSRTGCSIPSPDLTEIPESVPGDPTLDSPSGALQGTNDFGEIGYRGPCPPGGAVHTYQFTLYALDSMLDVPAGESVAALRGAIEDHQLAVAQFSAPYG